ncbi:hypothetical protein [Sinorhizobium meliloti]|uniref:hypothetical protein n=1 Tax=Rhizobium meliloti TaxID=382 RepID=UPI00299D92D7|nr:hypothetical protein [Sinorhizobium meliloti]
MNEAQDRSGFADTPEKTLNEYAKTKKARRAGNDYTFTISIDNQTDINFDDSIFAWAYSTGGGGMATGYSWPAYTSRSITVASGGCIKHGGGDLYEGTERLKLEPYGDAGDGYCWTGFGWDIFYEDKAARKVSIRRREPLRKQR